MSCSGEVVEKEPELIQIRPSIVKQLKKAKYGVADHSTVGLCHWTKKSFRGEGTCYKHKFYGISTHSCMEFSPAGMYCESLLAARNLNNKFVYVPVRALLAAIRTFPSILWAILFVIIVGLGPFAGVLAIIMYTVGFIAKLQYEAIEAIDADPMDAVGAIGVSKLQLIRFVVLPESASHLLSQILYIFDYNIRQTSILGLVGAGGIGFYIINYIKFFEYGKAAVFMLVVLATVLIIEWVSVRVRDKYIVKSQRGMQVKS